MTQEALKMALEALETELSIDWTNNDEFNASAEKMYEAITAIKEALAQEQEPVAWVVYSSAENDIVWADKGKRLKQNTPLYTTPPQRTWVGLTDDEIAQGCKESWVTEQAFQSAVWWAEDKLKEKNT
jgi:hypothetical protein